ncbi:hypothetical protein L7F22_021623 [Adiantum nelumboides]|nr:hypothetical protein [Adiantum nelumboides]
MRRQCYVVGDGNSSPKDVQEDCEQQDGLELLELERSSLRANMFSRGNIERRNSTSEAYLALKDATNVACSSLFNNNNITSQATSVSRFSRTIKKPRRYVQNIEEKENVWNRGKKYKSSLDKTKGLGECKEITMVDMDIEVMEAIAVEGMHLMDIDEMSPSPSLAVLDLMELVMDDLPRSKLAEFGGCVDCVLKLRSEIGDLQSLEVA